MKTQNFKTPYLFALTIVLFLVNCASVTFAQNSITWDKLGTKVVDYAIDHDVVTASSQETYNSLKVKVNNGTVNVYKVTIHFANGDTQDVKLPSELTKENDGKLIDLKGNQRVIEKITFWYSSKMSDKDKSVVEIWARKSLI
jgi:NADH dehydrogenase/NADH:ubiquinone oxidoreductase subunit G